MSEVRRNPFRGPVSDLFPRTTMLSKSSFVPHMLDKPIIRELNIPTSMVNEFYPSVGPRQRERELEAVLGYCFAVWGYEAKDFPMTLDGLE
jgi:hypothetical protein